MITSASFSLCITATLRVLIIITTCIACICGSNGTVVASPVANPSICYEICANSTYSSTEDIGECIQRPINEGGQGNEMAEMMKAIHDAAVAANIRPGVGGNNTLLAGMNAAAPGSTSLSPEGLLFCVADQIENNKYIADALYWVPNCNLAKIFCRNLTVNEVDMNGTVAYVVDEGLHGDDKFHRYVFTTTTFAETNFQSPTLSTGLRCSDMPWFRNSGYCMEPLATTCPTSGGQGRNANQFYGDTSTAVVGQQLREMHLSPCLDSGNDGKD